MNVHAAIQSYCRECENSRSAADCHVADCPLYPYRAGREGKATLADWIAAVITRCDDCTGYETKRTLLASGYRGKRPVLSFTRQGCRVGACPLHEWRDGWTAQVAL